MKLLTIFRNVKTRYKVLQSIERHEELIKEVQANKIRSIKKAAEYSKYWSIEKDYQRNLKLLKELL